MSTPRPNPLGAAYDQSLLNATHEVTKAERQEGYNVDLLKEEAPRPIGIQQPTSRSNTGELENGHLYPGAYPKQQYSTAPINQAKLPWWRTRAGIIGLAILAIVIVGAVVGGAVGGTVGHKKSDSGGTLVIGTPSNSSVGQNQNPAPTSTDSSSTPAPSPSNGQQISPQQTNSVVADLSKVLGSPTATSATDTHGVIGGGGGPRRRRVVPLRV